ncbi:hypothetical protein [Mannheimia indoligenes]|uniref:hypothetical protein n=1 Tax=Mannheimia indoligenes TaxID=3103145 RepID=UPI002FE684C6
MKKLLISLVMMTVLAACSSKPKIEQVKMETEKVVLSDNSIAGLRMVHNNQARNKYLRIVTRGDNASAVAGDVTKTIFCNPFSLFNIIGACSAKIYTHSKEELLGEQTTILNIAETYAYPKYKALLQQNIRFSKPLDYSGSPVYFAIGENYLIYDNAHYKLNVQFSVVGSGGGAASCEESKSGFTKEQWEANNYSLAVSEGKKLVDLCIEKLGKSHFENLGKLIELENIKDL